LLGGFHLSANERIQVEKDADREEDSAEAHKEHEGNWAASEPLGIEEYFPEIFSVTRDNVKESQVLRIECALDWTRL
jgi:hypothetical protein